MAFDHDTRKAILEAKAEIATRILMEEKLRELVPDASVCGTVHESFLVECKWADRERVRSIMCQVMEEIPNAFRF